MSIRIKGLAPISRKDYFFVSRFKQENKASGISYNKYRYGPGLGINRKGLKEQTYIFPEYQLVEINTSTNHKHFSRNRSSIADFITIISGTHFNSINCVYLSISIYLSIYLSVYIYKYIYIQFI